MGHLNGKAAGAAVDEALQAPLLPSAADNVPKDSFNVCYIIYFTLGAGFLLRWNAFITAVDYFDYLYPGVSVDRIFSVVNMGASLVSLLPIMLFFAHRSDPHRRTSLGLWLFVVTLVAVPAMDLFYIKGEVGIYGGFYVTVGVVALGGASDSLVQSGLIGSAGELPARYMQAIMAGTAASGVLVSFLRIFTKAAYPHDASGLRRSANLYFAVGIVFMFICIFFNRVAHKLPVIQHFRELKMQAIESENQEKGISDQSLSRSTFRKIFTRVKWHGLALTLSYMATLSIFPGYLSEDVHSDLLKDWFPVLLITAFNIFDLIGKCLTAVYLIEDDKIAVGAGIARLVFCPLFMGCLHGPAFFRTEVPVAVLTCLLGLTNGYCTSVLMILTPKKVQIQHAAFAGIVLMMFSGLGMVMGSILSWLWMV